MLLGDDGLGKSWITKCLAEAAVAEGHETFLGRPVCKHGRVLYVDEEKPRTSFAGVSRTRAQDVRQPPFPFQRGHPA
jgi:hypothetical protein